MDIWQQTFSLDDLNAMSKNTLVEHLNIQYCAKTNHSLSASMPVTSYTHQPFGMLHGGASVVLAETLASVCGNMCVDKKHYCVGIEINANHIKGKKQGVVIGTTEVIHLGKTTQIWQVDIKDEEQQLIATSRVTLLIKKMYTK